MILYENSSFSAHLRLRFANASGVGADTLLAESHRGIIQPVFFLFSLPVTGNYYVQVERDIGSGSYNAYLRKTTVTVPGVAVDHRDIVVVSSPDGVSGWTAKRPIGGRGGSTVTAAIERFGPRHRAATVRLAVRLQTPQDGRGRRLDLVAADNTRERTDRGRRRDDAQFTRDRRRRCASAQQNEIEQNGQTLHELRL